MSAPREFWILRNSDADTISSCEIDSDEAIQVIEKTPEVVRKLECFDELVKALEFYADDANWIPIKGNTDLWHETLGTDTSYIPGFHDKSIGGKLAREIIKKTKGE